MMKDQDTVYRIKPGTRCYFHQDGLRLLSESLNIVKIDPCWLPLFQSLHQGGALSLSAISNIVSHIDHIKTMQFLDELVFLSFLSKSGNQLMRDFPFVSIIIPVKNRPDEINACLKSLSLLDYPQERYEIIVVDDASTNSLIIDIEEKPFQIVRIPHSRGASYCRNLGAKTAKGEILAFIDSDCLSHPEWLTSLIPAFIKPRVAIVGGYIDSYDHKTLLDRYEKKMSSLTMGEDFKRTGINHSFFYVPTCNMLVKKDVFLSVGGFNEDLSVGEDVDFCLRISEQGYDTEYWPMGIVFHKHRNRLRSFSCRRFDYGTSEPLLFRLHRLMPAKKFILPLWFCFFWIVSLGAVISGHLMWLPLTLIGSFLICGYSWLKKTRNIGIPFHVRESLFIYYKVFLKPVFYIFIFLDRYFLLFIFLLIPFFQWFSILLMAHVVYSACVYYEKRLFPSLSFSSFLFYFTTDQISYQLGVFWGCIKERSFRVLKPSFGVVS